VNTPYRDATLTRFPVTVMALVLVASVIMTGCGGDAKKNKPPQGSKTQTTNQESTTKQAAQKSTTKQAANRESVSGTVINALPDKDAVYIRPPNAKVVIIQYKPDEVNVTLAGKQAKPDAISEGQQATVKYVKRTRDSREINRALSIWLQPGSGATQGSETTG
jgi:hypothetical protein